MEPVELLAVHGVPLAFAYHAERRVPSLGWRRQFSK
jgi:hypothetical protein